MNLEQRLRDGPTPESDLAFCGLLGGEPVVAKSDMERVERQRDVAVEALQELVDRRTRATEGMHQDLIDGSDGRYIRARAALALIRGGGPCQHAHVHVRMSLGDVKCALCGMVAPMTEPIDWSKGVMPVQVRRQADVTEVRPLDLKAAREEVRHIVEAEAQAEVWPWERKP